jgi:hypothetical protein
MRASKRDKARAKVGGGRVVPVKIRKAPPTVKKCTKADIE